MIRKFSKLLRGPFLGALFSVALLALPAVAQAQASPRVTLMTRTDQALAGASDAGHVPPSQPLSLILTLKPSEAQSAALEQLLQDQAAFSSPRFHQWLTAQQFAAQFGASSAELSAVSAWAVSQGLSVDAVSPSGLRASVSGSASRIERAFAVSLHNFQINGRLVFANTTQPSLPVDLASAILAIDGLDNLSPLSFDISYVNSQRATVTSTLDFSSVSNIVDANAAAVLNLKSLCESTVSPSKSAEYRLLLQQATAQGITVPADQGCAAGAATAASLPSVDKVSPVRSATSNPVAASVTLTSNVAATLSGYSITLTADLSGATASAITPTGNISFYVAGPTPRLLGVSAAGLAGAGLSVAVLATPNIPTGAQTIYAVYAGDSNFSSAVSNNLSIGVSDYNVTFVPQSLTVARGQSGQMTLVLGLINSFPGTVAFGCTPPPNSEITCSFSPTTLTGGGTSTMTLQTTAPKTSSLHRAPQPGFRAVGGILCAALLGCFLPIRRQLPSRLLMLLALALAMNLGCAANNFTDTGPVTDAGTPLGTASVIVNTAGTDGINTVRHNYPFQLTVQ